MGIYKLSSQFTDFVTSVSKNPEKILTQVGDAINDLAGKGVPLPFDASALSTFHEDQDASDYVMLEEVLQGTPNKKNKTLNAMYEVLGHLAGTGEIDMITRRVIEKFLSSAFNPWPVDEVERPAVVRRRKTDQEPQAAPEIEEREYSPKWEMGEDRLIRNLDADKVASVYQLLTVAGVLEKIPNKKERAERLRLRQYQWAKFL